MKTSNWIAALALAGAATSAPARADVVSTHYEFRGNQASASFSWATECSWGDLMIVGGDDVVHDAGGPPVSSGVTYAWLFSMDWCTGSYVMGSGVVEGASIHRLASAELSVPLDLYGRLCSPTPDDPMGGCEEIAPGTQATLGVSLVAEGPTSSGAAMTNVSGGSYRTHSRATGSRRAATATASFVVGGRDLLDGVTATSAEIASNATSSHWFYAY